MKRLLIENESELGESELSVLETMYNMLDIPTDDRDSFFTDKAFEATWQSMETWQKVQEADEIYAATSLIDSLGVSGGLLFNNLMHQAIKTNMSGKKVFLLNRYHYIWWENLDEELFNQVFASGKNELYVFNEEYTNFTKVIYIKS